MDLRAYILQFDCLASTEIRLPPFKGSAIRGAFFSALRGDVCLDRRVPGCSSCQARQSCPVSTLLVTVDESSVRGIEVTRPCTIEPPLETQTLYRPGDPFSFGVTLFGNAWELLAYVVLGVRRMGEIGLGNRGLAPGRFGMEQMQVIGPLSANGQQAYSHGERVPVQWVPGEVRPRRGEQWSRTCDKRLILRSIRRSLVCRMANVLSTGSAASGKLKASLQRPLSCAARQCV